MRGMPIGHDDFRELRDRDLYYVDKTPLIDMVLRYPAKAAVITRPRRFGKSLNMSMLDAYLNMKYAGERDRFSDLKISEIRPDDPEKNGNVVVFVSLKDLGNGTYASFLRRFADVASILYGNFIELKTSDKLDAETKAYFDAVYGRKMEPASMDSCLLHLCMMLTAHHGKAPIVLIDEYDSIMNASYGKPKDHELIMRFMRTFLSTALKSNDCLRFAVLTGVTRISGETAGPNLNNLCFHDVLSKKFDGMYGFTRAEVEKLLVDNGYGDKIEEALEWYGGYRFGGTDVCSPWSILHYIDGGCKPGTYWADTSGNSIVADLVSDDSWWVWKDLETLFSGGAIHGGFSSEFEYYDRNAIDSSIYSVMVATGYLQETCSEGSHKVSIPNKEVHEVFRQEILRRFGGSGRDASELIRAMVERNRG